MDFNNQWTYLQHISQKRCWFVFAGLHGVGDELCLYVYLDIYVNETHGIQNVCKVSAHLSVMWPDSEKQARLVTALPKKHIAMGKSHEVTYDYDPLSLIHKDRRQEEVWPKAVQELFRGTKLFWYRSWTGMIVLSSKLHVVLMQPRSEWRFHWSWWKLETIHHRTFWSARSFFHGLVYTIRFIVDYKFYNFLFHLPLCACFVLRFTLGILYTELIHEKKRGDCHC